MKEIVALFVVAALLSGSLYLRSQLTETVLLGQLQDKQLVVAKHR